MSRPDDWNAAPGIFAALEAAAHAWFETERVPRDQRQVRRVALLRYQGQGAELAIDWPGDSDAAMAAFVEAHRTLNGFSLDTKVELVTLRVEAEAAPPLAARNVLPRGCGAQPIGRQIIHHASGPLDAAVYDRARLGAGDRIEGPAIITQLDATTLVAPGWQAEVLSDGSCHITRQTA